mgnify:CR=1 FL=1
MSINTANFETPIELIGEPVNAPQNDLLLAIPQHRLTTHFWDNVKSDGGDIRICTDSLGVNELPIHVKSIDTVTKTAAIWTRASTYSNSARTFYLFYGNALATKYLVGDTFGQYAVYADYAFVSHDGLVEDTPPTAVFTGVVASNVSKPSPLGQLGGRFQGGANIDKVIASLDEYTMSLWYRPVSTSSAGADLILLQNLSKASSGQSSLLDDSSPADIGMFNSPNSWMRSGKTRQLNTYQLVVGSGSKINSTRSLHVNGKEEVRASLSSESNRTRLRIGNRYPATSSWYVNADLAHIMVRGSVTSDTHKELEYKNQSDPESFWGLPSDTLSDSGKALKKSHALYSNITRALSADLYLPQLTDLLGVYDTQQQSATYVQLSSTPFTFTAQQGIARDATHWFGSSSSKLEKYDLNNTLSASNNSPYANLPAGLDHLGDCCVDDNYLYVGASNFSSGVTTKKGVVIFNKSDLSFSEYISLDAYPNINPAGVCISKDGSELLICNFSQDANDPARNKFIHRINLTTKTYAGSYELPEQIFGMQGIDYSADDDFYYVASYPSYNSNHSRIVAVSADFIVKSTNVLLDVNTSELEGVCCFDGVNYLHKINEPPKTFVLKGNMYVHTSNGSAVQFANRNLIPDSGTLVLKLSADSLYSGNTIFDNQELSNDWEAWVDGVGAVTFGVNSTDQVTSIGAITAGSDYILAFSWDKSGSNVIVKVGLNGALTSSQSGSWVNPPEFGLWLAGVNASNNLGNFTYKDLLLFNKALSDAELVDVNDNFESLYQSDDAPTGTPTLGTITTTTTTATIPFTYTEGDETGFDYRIDGGSAVDSGTTNPIVLTGLTAGTSYDIEVRAYNATGDGSWSSVGEFDTEDAPSGGVTGSSLFTITKPSFASAGSATLPQPSGLISFNIANPLFASSGSVTLPQPSGAASFTVAKPVFAGSGSATLQQPDGSISFTIAKPIFTATGTATTTANTGAAIFDIAKPTFNASGEATLPQPSGIVGVTIGKPTFTATGSATIPGWSAAGNITIDKPIFTATGSTTLPAPTGSVEFAIDKPIFSGYATVSGIVIINGANSTLTLEIKSNTITI